MPRRTEWLAVLACLGLAFPAHAEEAPAYPAEEPVEQPAAPPAAEPIEPVQPAEPIPPIEPAEPAEEPIVVPQPDAHAEPSGARTHGGGSAGGPLLHGTLELGLEDAIRMGLENNLDVEVERYGPMLAEFDVDAAWGVYDPELFAEGFYRDSRTPNSFVLSGVAETVTRSLDGATGLRGILPILGTQYNAEFNGSREQFNSTVQTLSPEYNSGWAIDITQPILRDLIWNEPWTRVRSSRILLGSSQEGFRGSVMDVVQRIEDAYWGLIAAEEALRVANKSVETAAALLDQTKTQFEVGVVSKVEVTEAEAGVSQRAVDQIRALNQYRNQQDRLIDLVLGPNLRAASTLELRPTDRPDDFVAYEIDVAGAVSRAFEHRPELAQAEQEIERSEIQAQFARNQMLPALDGVFSYGESGLSGDQNRKFRPCNFVNDDPTTPAINERLACLGNPPPPNAFSQGGWHNTFDDYDDSPSYVAGARFSIPIPNRTARATASRSEIELARARTQKVRLEQQIILDVREAARNLKAAQEGIVAARESRRAAAEQLRAEEIRLEYGESTPFDVLQREEDLVQSERVEIEAFYAYRQSVTRLDRAQGTILRNRNIDIAPTAAVR